MERESPVQAERGLEMVLNDCVEMSIDWSPEAVALFDTKLRDNGAPTLSQVRMAYSRQYLRLLKRGHIKSLAEYYLVKGIVDGCSIEPGAVEFSKLMDMLADYENSIPPPERP